MAQKDRKTFQARIERLGRNGDLHGAIAASLAHLESDPQDWSAILALGELYLRGGRDEEAIACFTKVADHYHAEGFHPKAVALYRKIVRIRPDDHAFLCLADLAAHQGLLVEAKEYLMALEKHRRARGDDRGADECLASLDALIAIRVAPPPPVTPPDARAADPPEVTTKSQPAHSATGDFETTTSSAPRAESTHSDGGAELTTRAPDAAASIVPPLPPSKPVARSARRPPGKGRTPGAAAGSPVKPLQAVFNELRARARDTDDAAIAHERFDLAQYHLRDGNEDAAMTELQEAAKAPVLRFAAAAQLGRLLAGRGELQHAVEWLERAAAVPPVTPDEGLAVLYELADSLQQMGEPARALAVFMELHSQRRAYRDVAARIAALSAADAGDPHA